MPVFTIKALSHYLGDHVVHSNAGKVLLVEKQTAIEIFGYAHAMQGSLVGSYLTYTGLALSIGEKDPAQLSDGGKKYLLRNNVLEEVKDNKDAVTDTTDDIEDFQDLL